MLCARNEINQSALRGMVGGAGGEGVEYCRPRMGRKALILRTRHSSWDMRVGRYQQANF